nr:MAG TPA: hypothetical protein [Caudoviricetes sp.]
MLVKILAINRRFCLFSGGGSGFQIGVATEVQLLAPEVNIGVIASIRTEGNAVDAGGGVFVDGAIQTLADAGEAGSIRIGDCMEGTGGLGDVAAASGAFPDGV